MILYVNMYKNTEIGGNGKRLQDRRLLLRGIGERIVEKGKRRNEKQKKKRIQWYVNNSCFHPMISYKRKSKTILQIDILSGTRVISIFLLRYTKAGQITNTHPR